MAEKLLVSIFGPTAVGKTSCSIELAKHYQSEILSADSRQFFREMNIGTAKPSADELAQVQHHFINSHSIEDEFNVYDFESQVVAKLDELFNEHDVLFLVGGSGLYLHSIWQGFDKSLPGSDPAYRKQLESAYQEKGIEYLQNELKDRDPATYNIIDLNNPVRLIRALEIIHVSGDLPSKLKLGQKKDRNFKVLKIGLNLDRDVLYQRINERVDDMVNAGLLEEVKSLSEHEGRNALKTVGYQELFGYFRGEIGLDEAITKIKVNSRRYAKRQLTWFNRYNDIQWFEPAENEKMIQLIDKHIN